MFEDSTFESQGRIHTRSRAWMIATFTFNGSILLALILIPLFYPEALPRMVLTVLMEAPPAPDPTPKPVTRVARTNSTHPEMQGAVLTIPTRFPPHPFIPAEPEPPIDINAATAELGSNSGGDHNPFGPSQRPIVRPQVTGPVRVPSSLVEGLLIQKTLPTYPPIAVVSRIEGTVVLQASISRSGTIENVQVISGPIMLQQAALNAVQNWRYRPYLLNGDPVEVETTVNVIFKLQ